MRPPPPLPPKPGALAQTAPTQVLGKGYRTSCEPHMAQTAESAMAQGLPLAMLAGLLGVHKRTVMRWLEQGQAENADPVLAAFSAAVERGRAAFGAEGIKVLRAHALTDWKPMHELLKAQDPDTWAPKTKLDVKVEKAPEVEDLSGLPDEDLERIAALESELQALKKRK